MKKIHCIVVDDEPLARSLILMYVYRLAGWNVVAECRSVSEAYEALYQNSVDVIFLDINMPDKTGIDFLATLKDPPLVVFTTAYAEYAAKDQESFHEQRPARHSRTCSGHRFRFR